MQCIRRRSVTAIVLLGIAVTALAWFWQQRQFNVILVTLDTTRADRIGCYGYGAALTPALDAMAANGVLFERAYTPVPLTLPSHASMLTGLYPPEHGLHVNGMGRLTKEIPVLAEILTQKNYSTGAFLSAFVLNSKFGLKRGFQTYDDDLSQTTQAESFLHRRRDGRSVMDAALGWLKTHCAQPFFCWIHLYDAHGEYDARETLFGDRFTKQPYDAGIAVQDQQIGRLSEFLKSYGLTKQTLVIVVGDHGEGLMEHGEQEHGMLLYESAVRVPLVIAGLPIVKAGHRVATPVSLVDLMPTVLDCLAVKHRLPLSGRSLKPSMQGAVLEQRACYLETDAPFEYHWAPLRALITDRHKFIRTARPELYDLIDDPGETHDLSASAVSDRQDLENRLDEMLASFVPRAAGSVHLSAKEQQILSSLGYAREKPVVVESDSQQALPDVKEMLPFYNMTLEAQHLLGAQQITAAIEKLNAVLEQAPHDDNARVLLGDALMSQKNFPAAIKAYETVLEHNSEQPKAHAHLATALATQQRLPEAAAHYRRALEMDSEGTIWHLQLAQVLCGLRNYQAAVAEYREAIRCDPGYIRAQLELGGLLTELGRYDEAIRLFEATLKLQPDLPVAHLNLATVLSRAKRNREALPHAQKAVEIDPENFEARFNFGTLLLIENRVEDAIDQLNESLRLRPDDPRSREQLERAKAYLKSKRQ
jgi:arylsulfatase A-like enzyme/Tfp pilus assembly protein PilF